MLMQGGSHIIELGAQLALELIVLMSIACAVLLLTHRFCLVKLGAHYTYALWLLLPILLVVELAQISLPQWFSLVSDNAVTSSMATYTVRAGTQLAADQGTLWFILLGVYIVGLIWHLCRLGYQLAQLRLIKHHAHIVSQPSQFGLADTRLDIAQSEYVNSPVLVGVIRPVVLVPKSFFELSQPQQQAIVAHEQFHFQRKDHIANSLAYLLAVMMWFNPITWLAYKRFRHDQELSCDAAVTAAMVSDSKIAYSRALLAYSQHAPLSMFHTHYGDKTILKERILQMKKQHGKSTGLMLGLTASLVLCALFINPSVNAGSQHQAETKKAKQDVVYPTIRIEPKYPAQAAKEGLNGYVQLSFDISPAGNVSNVEIVKSSPKGVFDSSAKEALEQWQYQTSKAGKKGSLVQLDFVIHQPEESIERIQVH
ncbi:TonB family protein [Shewanella maritima]|uniref:M56 family metallopeptidase n=1 Tax=Shewanella maritima TaxID=2520507 RepID=UPI00373651A1